MNGLLNAIYDGLAASADQVTSAIRGYQTDEEARRADNREDRALVRAGHAPDWVADRREALDAEEWERQQYDLDVSALKEGSSWSKSDIEAVLNQHSDLTPSDIAQHGLQPEDFGLKPGRERCPGALSFAAVDATGALSLPIDDVAHERSPAEPELKRNEPDLELGLGE